MVVASEGLAGNTVVLLVTGQVPDDQGLVCHMKNVSITDSNIQIWFAMTGDTEYDRGDLAVVGSHMDVGMRGKKTI